MTVTTVPVPACPGLPLYPGSVLTTTIVGIFPEISEPDFVMELDTSTMMNCGTVAGGSELFPGSLVQLPLQVGGFGMVELAKPLKLDGAEPPLSELSFAHCAPQNVT